MCRLIPQGEARGQIAQLRNVNDTVFGFRRFFLRLFNNRIILLPKFAHITLAEYLVDSSNRFYQMTILGSVIRVSALFEPKQAFLLYISTRVTSENTLLNHSCS